MTVLLLLAVVVLVLLNGFFVAAEFALVRVRRSRMEEEAEEGRRGARLVVRQLDELSRYLAACQLGITFTSLGIGFLGEPAVADIFESILGDRAAARRHAGDLARPRLPDHDLAAHHDRRAGAEDLRDQPRRGRWRAGSRARCTCSRRSSARSSTCSTRRRTRCCGWLGIRKTDEFDEGGSPEELKVLIAQSLTGGKLDPGEASMLTGVFHLHEQQARQVMTPAPAVVTVDLSENVETALRRCVSSGHTRLVVTEDENHDRVKGIVHANALAQLLLTEGPEARIDEPRPRGADRARDQAARRPAGRPPAPAQLARRRDRRVRPHGRHRHGRGHHRGGRGRDRRRDRPARRRRAAARQRRLVRARARRDHRPRRLRARAAGRLRRLQLGRRVRVRRARAAAQARRHRDPQRLLDPGRVRAREPDRGGPDPRPPRRPDAGARRAVA